MGTGLKSSYGVLNGAVKYTEEAGVIENSGEAEFNESERAEYDEMGDGVLTAARSSTWGTAGGAIALECRWLLIITVSLESLVETEVEALSDGSFANIDR
jgi:hypothetical protein